MTAGEKSNDENGFPSAPRSSNGAESSLDDPRVVQAIEEYSAAIHAGKKPDRQEFLARHAEIAAILVDCLDGLDFVEGAVHDLNQGAQPGEATVESMEREIGRWAGVRAQVSQLGDFRIEREIGRGGMGVVYEAVQVSLSRRVALKVLPFAAMLDPRHLQRFKNEAQAAAQLDHPNIVDVIAVGSERGVHYYAMRFIEGRTLAEAILQLQRASGYLEQANRPRSGIHGGKLDATDAYSRGTDEPRAGSTAYSTLAIAGLNTAGGFQNSDFYHSIALLAVQAAEALDYAHQSGITHRDIKPSNLLLDVRGRLWITDFGLAHAESNTELTMTGDLLGTLRYMSPEQASARRMPVDHRTDIYSLGITLYEALTLCPAFTNDNRQQLLRQIADHDPVQPRKLCRTIPADLETIVLKAIEKSAGDRYRTAGELAQDLKQFIVGKPVYARRRSWFVRTMKWSRRHRGWVASAGAVVLAGLMVLAGSITWMARDRAARVARTRDTIEIAVAEAERLQGESAARPDDQSLWAATLAAAQRVEGTIAGGESSVEINARAKRVLTEIGNAAMDRRMLDRLQDIALRLFNLQDQTGFVADPDTDYVSAFRDYGIDLEQLSPDKAAARIASCKIRVSLAAALDRWAMHRGQETPKWQHLDKIARLSDPDPTRDQLRDANARSDKRTLVELAQSSKVRGWPTVTILLLVNGLEHVGASQEAVALLDDVVPRHPEDFFLNYTMGNYLVRIQPPNWSRAAGFLRAAVALRPENHFARARFGLALSYSGETVAAIAEFHEAIKLKPNFQEAHANLGRALIDRGDFAAAVEAYRQAFPPQSPRIRANLGQALNQRDGVPLPEGGLDEALRLNHNLARDHYNLGNALRMAGNVEAALAEYQEAIRLDPKHAKAYNNLVGTLPMARDKKAAIPGGSLFKFSGNEPVLSGPNPGADDEDDRPGAVAPLTAGPAHPLPTSHRSFSLEGNVESFAHDENGDTVVRSTDGEILRLATGNPVLSPECYVHSFAEDSKGAVIVLRTDGHLFQLSPGQPPNCIATGNCCSFAIGNGCVFTLRSDGLMFRLLLPAGEPAETIHSYIGDGHNEIVCLDMAGALFHYPSPADKTLIGNNVQSYAMDGANGISILQTDGKLFRHSPADGNFLLSSNTQSFTADGLGATVVLETNGTLWYHAAKASIDGGVMHYQFADRVRSVQADGLGGILYLNDGGNLSYWTADGPVGVKGRQNALRVADGVMSFRADGLGGVIYLTVGGGLSHWNAHRTHSDPVGTTPKQFADGVRAFRVDGLGGVVYLKTDGTLSHWTVSSAAADPGIDRQRQFAEGVKLFGTDGLRGIFYLKTDRSLWYWTCYGPDEDKGVTKEVQIASEVESFVAEDFGGVVYRKTLGMLWFWTAHGVSGIYGGTKENEFCANALSYKADGLGGTIYLNPDGTLAYFTACRWSHIQPRSEFTWGVKSYAADRLGGIVYLRTDNTLWYWTAFGSASIFGGTSHQQVADNKTISFQADGAGGIFYLFRDGTLWYWTAHGSASVYGGTLREQVAAGVNSYQAEDLGGVIYSKADGSTGHWTAHGSAAEFTTVTVLSVPISASKGTAFDGPVATFVDRATNGSPGDYQATISWGDQASSPGIVTGPDANGLFTIRGSHAYTEEADGLPFEITLIDRGGSSVTVHGTAKVGGLER